MIGKLIDELRSRANYRGRVITHETALLEELQLTHDELGAQLAELERTGLVEVLSPLPFLVLKLRMWPGLDRQSNNPGQSAYSYPKQLLQPELEKDSYRRASGGADQRLLHEILSVLGEDDPEAFRKALEHYSPQVIRAALDRVRRAKTIRKNRTALFRHLLPRIARETHNQP